jgi:hypothetical protein
MSGHCPGNGIYPHMAAFRYGFICRGYTGEASTLEQMIGYYNGKSSSFAPPSVEKKSFEPRE